MISTSECWEHLKHQLGVASPGSRTADRWLRRTAKKQKGKPAGAPCNRRPPDPCEVAAREELNLLTSFLAAADKGGEAERVWLAAHGKSPGMPAVHRNRAQPAAPAVPAGGALAGANKGGSQRLPHSAATVAQIAKEVSVLMGRRGSLKQKAEQASSFLFGASPDQSLRVTDRKLRQLEKKAGVGSAGVGPSWIVNRLSGVIDESMRTSGGALSGLVANVRRRILADGSACARALFGFAPFIAVCLSVGVWMKGPHAVFICHFFFPFCFFSHVFLQAATALQDPLPSSPERAVVSRSRSGKRRS